MEEDEDVEVKQKECDDAKYNANEEPNSQHFKHQELFQKQNVNVQVTCAKIMLNNHTLAPCISLIRYHINMQLELD